MSQGCILFITPWGPHYPYILMQFCMDDCRVCRSFFPSLVAVCEVLSPFFCKPCCHGFIFSGLDAETSICASAILLVFSSTAGLFNFFPDSDLISQFGYLYCLKSVSSLSAGALGSCGYWALIGFSAEFLCDLGEVNLDAVFKSTAESKWDFCS